MKIHFHLLNYFPSILIRLSGTFSKGEGQQQFPLLWRGIKGEDKKKCNHIDGL